MPVLLVILLLMFVVWPLANYACWRTVVRKLGQPWNWRVLTGLLWYYFWLRRHVA